MFKGFEGPDHEQEIEKLTTEDHELLDKLAAKVVEWHMTVPAIIFLESVKPLNFIGSQAMVFFEPFVGAILPLGSYNRFRVLLERRSTLEVLLQKIEASDAEAYEKERELKEARKAARQKEGKGLWRRLFPGRKERNMGGR